MKQLNATTELAAIFLQILLNSGQITEVSTIVHTTLRAEISWFPCASIRTGRANGNPCWWEVVTLAYQARKARALMACSFQQQKENSNFFIAFVNIVL